MEGAKSLRVGDPLDWNTEIGPMVSAEQFELVRELVDDAVAQGAVLRCGGPVEVSGHPSARFYAPTVLTGVTHEMRIMREEIFGPVIPIVTVADEDEAIALANDSRVRPRRLGLDDEQTEGRPHRAPDRGRHGLGQRPHVQPRRLLVRVGRRQGLRPRPLALEVRLLRVRQRQAARVRAVARRATSGGTPTTSRWARRCTPRRTCSTAATPTGRASCGAGCCRC